MIVVLLVSNQQESPLIDVKLFFGFSKEILFYTTFALPFKDDMVERTIQEHGINSIVLFYIC